MALNWGRCGFPVENCAYLYNLQSLHSCVIYRVSIMSFPDYKHLLQENYVEYKHIFLPLLKLVSNKMVHLRTGVQMFVGFWMQHFQTGGLGEMVRHPGHHDRLISPP